MKIKKNLLSVFIASVGMFFIMFFGIYSSYNFGANIYGTGGEYSMTQRIIEKMEKNTFKYENYSLDKNEFSEVLDKKIFKVSDDKYLVEFNGATKGDSLHKYEYEINLENGKIKSIKKI